MGTHPIFESDFDCLTESVWLPNLRDTTRLSNAPSTNGTRATTSAN